MGYRQNMHCKPRNGLTHNFSSLASCYICMIYIVSWLKSMSKLLQIIRFISFKDINNQKYFSQSRLLKKGPRLDHRMLLEVQTLPKEQRTRGLTSAYQSNFFRSYHKFKYKSWSIFSSESRPIINFKISTKHQHFA